MGALPAPRHQRAPAPAIIDGGRRVFISAGELSGDIAGAELTAEIRRRDPTVHVFGTGGPRMAEAGADIDGRTNHIGVVGITEAFATIPSVVRVWLSEIHGLLQSSVAAAGRVYEIIDLPGAETNGGLPLPAPVAGSVAFEGVEFAYREGQPVLDGFDLTIAAGERIAIVGATGCGKTTLARLLLRFYRPRHGRVTLDGIDLADLSVSDLRRTVCVIEQEPFLFSGSFADNIRYGSWSASRPEIERAASIAGLTPVLTRLPRGLDTRLSESGRELSGGEKQRVALARAIVRNPRVLVLDEATSALDGDTEAEIFTALEPWLRARTVIAIGHRLSMVGRFPRIVLLQRGARLADGPLERLVQTCPAFVTLFAEQLSLSESARE